MPDDSLTILLWVLYDSSVVYAAIVVNAHSTSCMRNNRGDGRAPPVLPAIYVESNQGDGSEE